MKKRILLLLAALLALLPAVAGADVRLYAFPAEEPPKALLAAAFAIPAEETTLTLTFAGDCTLGSEPEYRSHHAGFAKKVEQEGLDWPFSGLKSLFAADDATLVNLEGVLSAGTANRAEKQFTFLGDPAYAEILTLGSVECVTLANNHSMDFGRRGYRDTCNALSEAGIGFADADTVLVIEKEGYRIGITASCFSLGKREEAKLAAQMETLRQLGCHALVHVMHAGVEYAPRHSDQQQKVAETAVRLGADLVVGHHPHVAQDAVLLGASPVFYSLGNCSFGGNMNPSVREGLVLQIAFRFAQGSMAELDWALYPILTTGGASGNDYRPTLPTGEAGRQLMEQLARSTGLPKENYTEETGAWRPTLPTP